MSPDNVCVSGVTCPPEGGGGVAYASTGGVNPTAYTTFKRYSTSSLTGSFGYDSTSQIFHGANGSSGSLLYTGSSTLSTSSTTVTLQHSLKVYNETGSASQAASVVGTYPSTIPAQGTFSVSSTIPLTITNDASGATSTAYLTVQGVPCSLALVQTDSTGENFSLTYTNLNTGASTVWNLTFPFVLGSTGTDASGRGEILSSRRIDKIAPWVCVSGGIAVCIVGGAAILLGGWALLPAAAAFGGAAYAAGVGAAAFGMGAASYIGGYALSFAGCAP